MPKLAKKPVGRKTTKGARVRNPRSGLAAGPKQKATPFLMFNGRLAEALALYTKIFPDSKVLTTTRSGKNGPMQSAVFIVGGQRFMAYDGGAHFKFSEAFSVFIDCADQAEVDLYWNRLLKAGGTPTMCGWMNDPFGLSWQIIPRRLMELVTDPDPRKAKAALDAMLKMQKIDVKGIEKAYAEA